MQTDESWTELDRSATDTLGEYRFELPSPPRRATASSGPGVLDAGRQSEATSDAIAIKILDPTQLEAQVRKFARADRTMLIPGRVTPAAKRDIIVETSPDGQTWTQATTTTSAPANGKFVAQLDGLTPGPIQIRIRVDESAASAPTIGDPTRVSVEDYEAAR